MPESLRDHDWRQVNVRFSQDDYRRMRRVLGERDMKISAFVRELVGDALDRVEHAKTEPRVSSLRA